VERAAAEARARDLLDEAVEAGARHREELEAARQARVEAERAAAEQATARLAAEEAAEQRAVDRGAVEAVVRHHTEVAEEVIQERIAAEQRAGELAEELAQARAELLENTSDSLPRIPPRTSRRTPVPPEPDPVPPPPEDSADTGREPDDSGGFFAFQGADDTAERTGMDVSAPATSGLSGGTRMFAAPGPPAGQMAALLVVAGLAAVTAAFALVTGRLLGPLGLVALVVLGVAGYAASRLRPSDVRVGIDGGVVSIVRDGGQHRFDVTDPRTEVRIQGTTDDPEWRVMFLRRTLPPLVVDARMVDPVAFTSALRKWRPEL
jgi:hypothetical protein